MISLGLGPYLDNQFASLPLSVQVFLASTFALVGIVGFFCITVWIIVTEFFHMPFTEFLDKFCGVESDD